MSTKRMRVFAEPNGSGKTTILNGLKEKIKLGVYINANDIEKTFVQKGSISLNDYHIKTTEADLQTFFLNSSFSPVKRNETNLWEKIFVVDNEIRTTAVVDSYLAADLAEFFRQKLLDAGESFTYETVMSHEAKIDFLEKASTLGYQVYLYYLATEDPEININRVSVRVNQNGHYVEPKTIEKRYFKSLNNLKPAIRKTHRAFVFDNSGAVAKLVAEIENGTDVNLVDPNFVPQWFMDYVVKKQ